MKFLNKRFILAALAALAIGPAFGQNKPKNVLDLKYSIQDSEIVFPESYDVNTQRLLERWYLKNYTSSDLEATSDYDPGATDEEIRERLGALPTVIDLPYNSIVRAYIERYTKRGRKQVTALLGLSSYYMPIFEQALEEAGLPLELKYLPVIESGLDPCATSKHGAAGLWQFIIASARGYDMEVNSLVDERRDPYISSAKACQMLKDLYETFGDWSLAIAAYNCGPGTVTKALARAGGQSGSHDFWSIYYYLPAETRGYVPMFIAANYVMNYYPEHNISPVLATKPLITDTIHLTQRVHFNQIAAVLDIPVDELRVLNPQFRADIIPGSPDHPYNLILPSQQIHAYVVSEEQILNYEREQYARRMDATPGDDPNLTAEEIVATELEQGEPLNPADPTLIENAATEIAYEETHPGEASTPTHRRNSSSTQSSNSNASAQSASDNGNASGTASSAQSASSTGTQTAAASSTTANTTTTSTSTNTSNSNKKKDSKKKESKSQTTTHTVASGENLTVIAKKYGVTVDELKKANPKQKDDMIHPGDKLTIPSKSSTKKKKKR